MGLLATLLVLATVGSILQTGRDQKEAANREAQHEGESRQFKSTLDALLGRMSELQKEVDTQPLLRQNESLMREVDETKREISGGSASTW